MGKLIAFLIVAVIVIGGITWMIFQINESQRVDDENDSFFIVSDNPQGEISDINVDMNAVLMEVGYTIEQASAIQEILNTLGVESIEIIEMTGIPTEGLNAVISYPNGLSGRNTRFWFTTDDGVLFYAGRYNEDLYDIELGGFIMAYDDVHIPETQVDLDTYNQLQQLSIETVKIYLTHPSSANFRALHWGVGRSDDKYMIRGRVNASNAFGASNDLNFTVWFLSENNQFTVEAVVIDGVQVK